MKFSAANLVKKSASALLYIEIKKIKWQQTYKQIKGNEYAEQIVEKNEGSAEKRGIISINGDLLFFCVDMVKDNKLIEIKMVDDEENYENWYLESSIMQSTFYATCATKVKTLDTPKFRKKEGYSQEVIPVPIDFIFELWFGDKKKFQVFPNDNVYNHYVNKMHVINEGIKSMNFDECRAFDYKYKFNEFKIYQPKFIKL